MWPPFYDFGQFAQWVRKGEIADRRAVHCAEPAHRGGFYMKGNRGFGAFWQPLGLVAATALFATQTLDAQATLKGRILDSETGQRIASARVSFSRGTPALVADSI